MRDCLHVLHICRRFGPVGGMERYVWELTRALAAMGHRIEVLCEVNLCDHTPEGVTVHALGAVRPKPRWLAHVRFSRRVQTWLEANPCASRLIHSHERTANHHLTTFHGPPYAEVRYLPLWKRMSLRVWMNLWLEKRELYGEQVRRVIPNSWHIREQLLQEYPAIKPVMCDPIAPGVSSCLRREPRSVEADAGVVGFVGKEWKRKGLPQAIQIMRSLSALRPNVLFRVIGPAPAEVQSLCEGLDFRMELRGEVPACQAYAGMDVLLHPAKKEPYGMVVTEALSAGVPVVLSDVCGASTEVAEHAGRVLALTSDVQQWVEAVDDMLRASPHDIHYQRSWQRVAREHVPIYQKVESMMK